MPKKNLFKLKWQWKTRMYIAILLGIIFSVVLISDVQALGRKRVHVLVEGSRYNNGCNDPLGDWPDLYWSVSIDGTEHNSRNESLDDPCPPIIIIGQGCIAGNFFLENGGKDFVQEVDGSKENIEIVIKEWDKDGGLIAPDDQCDIRPGPGNDLILNLNLLNCQIMGDAAGVCDTSITVDGANNPGQDPSHFVFKVSIEEPPHAEGLSLRCLHSPIWPQPGDNVTIQAWALDGVAAPIANTEWVEDIEIWVDNDTNSPKTTATTPGVMGMNSLDFIHTPAVGADQIRYRCRIKNNGLWVSSGWHIVQIGEPATGRAVPILYTGVPDSRLDIVFIADRIDYTGPNDPQFLTDVQTAIRDAYYAADTNIRNGGRTFLFNQDAMNFWIALDTGEACDYFVSGSTCRDHVLPNKWDTTYSFADSGALVHTRNLRDFAEMDRRAFSVGTNSLDNYLHELGHSPFGLSDEYCPPCDSYYFQPEPYPNIYSNQTDCLNDPLAAGVTDACELAITSTSSIYGGHHDWWKYGDTQDWFRVESAASRPNDLMQDWGDHTANPADELQLNWYFNECRGGAC